MSEETMNPLAEQPEEKPEEVSVPSSEHEETAPVDEAVEAETPRADETPEEVSDGGEEPPQKDSDVTEEKPEEAAEKAAAEVTETESEEVPSAEETASKEPKPRKKVNTNGLWLVLALLLAGAALYGLFTLLGGRISQNREKSLFSEIQTMVPGTSSVTHVSDAEKGREGYLAMSSGKVKAYVLDTTGVSGDITVRLLVGYNAQTIRYIRVLSVSGGFNEVSEDFIEESLGQAGLIYEVIANNPVDEAAKMAVQTSFSMLSGLEIYAKENKLSQLPYVPETTKAQTTAPSKTGAPAQSSSEAEETTAKHTQPQPISLSTDKTPVSPSTLPKQPDVSVRVVSTETVFETETLPPETTPEVSTEPESSDPESTEPETSEPETTEPETTEPETTEPETTEPETTEPETTEPETTEPETTEPETTEPETTEPETTEPETTEPETTEPASTEPETTEPVTVAPETTTGEGENDDDEQVL